MTSNPIVTMINSANPNHPRIMAAVPTPLLTLPLPKSWAIVLAPTDAVCCQRTETSTKTEATKMSARATWETGREGNGLTSRSEPLSSCSSCQPGNVARRRKQTNARTMATIIKYGKTMLSLKTRSVVTAQKRATVGIDAYTEVANTDFELRLSNDVGNRRCDPGVDL